MGLDVQRFCEQPDNEFLCKCCLEVLDEPVQAPCSHAFCAKCVSRLAQANPRGISTCVCPWCHAMFAAAHVAPVPAALKRSLLDLTLRCENSHRGCQEIIRVDALAEHVCGFSPVFCPFPGCDFTYGSAAPLNRHELLAHKEGCEWRCQPCLHGCGAVFPAKHNFGHEMHCVRRPVQCTQNCGLSIPCDEVSLHIDQHCPNTVVQCEVQGCSFALQRHCQDDWNSHYASALETHVHCVFAQQKKKDDEILRLSQMVESKTVELKSVTEEKDLQIAHLHRELKRVKSDLEARLSAKEKQLLEQSQMLRASRSRVVEDSDDISRTSTADRCGSSTMEYCSSDEMSCTPSHYSASPVIPNYEPSFSMMRDFDSRPRKRTRNWTSLGEMESPRHGCGAATDGNEHVFVMGGFDGSSTLDTLSIYSTTHGTWTSAEPMSTSRTWCAAAFGFDRLFVAGGCDANRRSLNTVEMYDHRLNKWCKCPSMSTPREGCAMVIVGHRLIVMGGFDGTRFLDSAEMLDLGTMKWVSLPSMTAARGACAAAVWEENGQVFVFGGSNDSGPLNTTEVLDINSLQWIALPPMTNPRVGGAMAFDKHNQRVYVTGGNPGFLNDVEYLDLKHMEWAAGPAMLHHRMGGASVCIGRQLIVVGGSTADDQKLSSAEGLALF